MMPIPNSERLEKEGGKGMRFHYLLTFAALLLLCAGVASAAVFPSVTMDFDPQTFTYTYHVLVPADNTYPFGQLFIYTAAKWTEDWQISGPWVGGVDQGWLADFPEGGPEGDTAQWTADAEQQVTIYPWAGDFIIVCPGTVPVPGLGMTKNGVSDSVNYFEINVPGPIGAIPEPSSLIAFGGLISLAAPIIRRRIH